MANLEGTLARHRTLVLIAGGGLLILGGIAAFDWLANRGKAQASAASATGSTSGNGATDGATTTPNLSNSETYINSFTDNSVHTTDSGNSPVTSNQYTPPASHTTPAPTHPATTPHPAATQPAHPAPAAPTSAGTLHPTSTPQRVYTVQPGDSLWAIAQHEYGIGADWTHIYDANRGTVGANPNLIYPGERLSIPSLN